LWPSARRGIGCTTSATVGVGCDCASAAARNLLLRGQRAVLASTACAIFSARSGVIARSVQEAVAYRIRSRATDQSFPNDFCGRTRRSAAVSPSGETVRCNCGLACSRPFLNVPEACRAGSRALGFCVRSRRRRGGSRSETSRPIPRIPQSRTTGFAAPTTFPRESPRQGQAPPK